MDLTGDPKNLSFEDDLDPEGILCAGLVGVLAEAWPAVENFAQ